MSVELRHHTICRIVMDIAICGFFKMTAAAVLDFTFFRVATVKTLYSRPNISPDATFHVCKLMSSLVVLEEVVDFV